MGIGDNPSCSDGPPTSLGWEHEDDQIFDIEDYESCRAPRRSLSQLKMGSDLRRKLLCENKPELTQELRRIERKLYRERRKCPLTKFFTPPPECEHELICHTDQVLSNAS